MQVLSACLGRWCHLICLLDMALKTEFMHTNIRFFFKFLFIYLFYFFGFCFVKCHNGNMDSYLIRMSSSVILDALSNEQNRHNQF
jgi:hypothetical protein